jgi:hypothetical protein
MRQGLGLLATVVLAWMSLGGSALGASPPPNGGTIAIEPEFVDGSYDTSMHAFVDAASEALTAKGFTVFDDPDHAAAVVVLMLSRSDVGTGLTRVPGERAPSVIGTGVAVPLGTGASRQVSLRRTRLELHIRRRGETGFVWDGTAVTVREAGTPEGADATVASDLSRALLQSYPAQPKDVVGVP